MEKGVRVMLVREKEREGVDLGVKCEEREVEEERMEGRVGGKCK